ncbi:bifunctional diaminohydroxyphosphoribosylaminopyrimidine deaminase/5-amino-6-(5-phosphoribosylamino)uracil reductase RibD [Saccharothrix saharensis]|uniref:bifunctional diaminohydroxyphosphoribosylaminopyrimidine deaminase/5-amino-6-(5-phosphoribosylamino)uracil reductase RibD n=1 Tax=Saccharothrix saharensis TaxID=571190 RepID=UPI003682BE53
MASEIEVSAMRRAVVLSTFGLGGTSPNPPVGCVVLDHGGRVIGEGYHQRRGEPHAEVQALAAAGDRARGGTAVVTLEPCNHHGLTPPCRQAVLDAGIARVVIGLADPTSQAGGGATRLRAAGVDVEVNVLADTVRQVLRPWSHALALGRPHVTWLYETDGRGRITSPSQALVRRHRAAVDAVVDVHGRISEGRPGAHGQTAFTLTATTVTENLDHLLKTLHAGGTRSVLAACRPDLSHRLLAARLVDQAVCYAVPADPSGMGEPVPASWPDGFEVEAVEPTEGWVRITATPSRPDTGTGQ